MGNKREKNSEKSKVNTDRTLQHLLRTLIFTVVVAGFVCAIFMQIQWSKGMILESARNNLRQSTKQIATTSCASWTSDAANVKELASILANTDNKDTVLNGIDKNEVVYRYLFVDSEATSGVASDGTLLKRDDGHQFSEYCGVSGIEVSESFLSMDGKWCYLYRCPVKLDGEMYGWIYAQYLFDRVHYLFTDKLYDGDGNCFIYDVKSGNIVYQLDESGYSSYVGKGLDSLASQEIGLSDATIASMQEAILNPEDMMLEDNSGGHNNMIYMMPVEENTCYFISIASETAVLKGLFAVRVTILLGAFISGIIIIILLLVINIHKVRDKSRREIERAREIHEKELQRAVDAANEANNAKSQFLANMSHEIRTPINAVIGMNEMIARECTDSNIVEYSRDVDDAARTLLQIVNDILDITKIESGKMELISVEYDLIEVINSLRSVLLAKAKRKQLLLTLELDETLPRKLYGDEVRIRQIVTNLITNAIKYTEEGKVEVRVNGKCEGKRVALSVSVEDTGIGIKEEDIPKLTEKFQRIDEKQNRNIEGTGLGLNITNELLEMMGSKLTVESEFGKGSRFSFTIWQDIIDDTPVGKYETNENKKNKKYETSFTAPDSKILVVDDNRVNQRIVQKLLEKTRIQISSADSGRECLELAADNKYDLILMDYMMPEMDGVDTLKSLRGMGGPNFDTPVIVLTANALVGARDEYIEAGFNDYLSKPINSEELEATVKKYVLGRED